MYIKNKTPWIISWLSPIFIFTITAFHIHQETNYQKQFDQFISTAVRSNMTDGQTNFFKTVTQLGCLQFIPIFFFIALFLLLRKKQYFSSAWLTINIVIGAAILNPLLKKVFVRPRPEVLHLVVEESYSFPSGHSIAAMLFYGSLIGLILLYCSSKWGKLSMVTLASLIILLIGVSRIYLGVHHPTDVLGGFLLGLSLLFFTSPLLKKQQAIG